MINLEKPILFDFSNCHKARLLPTLVFGSWMKTIDSDKSVINIRGTHGANYLKNIGFFKYIKVRKFKEQTITFNAKKKHIPIVMFNKNHYKSLDSHKDINQNITDEMRIITKQILANVEFHDDENKSETENVMTFLLREIIRNIFEHSRIDKYYLAMQIQPINNRIEIAILDEGVGIASSYTTNSKFKNYMQNPDIALKRSLVAGSSRMYKNEVEMYRKETQWENSGFGLFMTSRLCARLNGSFNIISSGHHIELTYDNDTGKYVENIYKNPFKGCAVGLEFSYKDISDFCKINDLILQEIEESQKGLKHLYSNPSEYSNVNSLYK